MENGSEASFNLDGYVDECDAPVFDRTHTTTRRAVTRWATSRSVVACRDLAAAPRYPHEVLGDSVRMTLRLHKNELAYLGANGQVLKELLDWAIPPSRWKQGEGTCR